MALPSFDNDWRDKKRIKPRILVLEICDRKKVDSDPIAWLFVERTETYRRDPRDSSVYEASIRLSYERITSKGSRVAMAKGSFLGAYSIGYGQGSVVSLTSQFISRGAVFLDLPGLEGQHIGTYLMNEIVDWCKQWPDARVNSIQLLSGQATEDNKARRNHFYEQFGLVFDYRDQEQREGLSKQMLVSNLHSVETWKENLREVDVRNFLGDVLERRGELEFELMQRERAIKWLSREAERAEAHPIRWALQRTWWRLAPPLVVVATLLGLGLVIWASSRIGGGS